MNWYNNVREGWRCPMCGRVYSPDTVMCLFCQGNYGYDWTCRSGIPIITDKAETRWIYEPTVNTASSDDDYDVQDLIDFANSIQ